MKHAPPLNKTARIAAPLLLALLLAIAVLPAAALAQPPGPNPGPNPQGSGPGSNPGPNSQGPGSNPGSNSQGPGSNPNVNSQPNGNPGGSQPNGNPGGNQPNGNPGTNQPGSNPPVNNQPSTDPHPSAPFTPPADCIVAHAATPAQLCPIDGGLQYYFIGADGSSQTGPWIRSFDELAVLGSVSVYSGTNPMTDKSVTITYLAADSKIRISTYYPDTEYDTDKPYIFTVDTDYNVDHESW
ncbi:MAG: hypothetical protein OXF50_23725 [Caldilineaceae bacterium]|nr:hypothetical protein [Caldilineaceae bacterium]